MGGKSKNSGRDVFKKHGVPFFSYPEDAVNVLEYVSYYHHVASKKRLSSGSGVRGNVKVAKKMYRVNSGVNFGGKPYSKLALSKNPNVCKTLIESGSNILTALN